jgi:uncharacterized protein YhbP (UPF0306 family)
MQDLEVKDIAIKYIREHNTMSLATCADNIPWAASVFYASSGFQLYFISNPSVCLHCKNISKNPRVAITINEDYRLKGFEDWRMIKGIQMDAMAYVIEDREELRKALQVYIAKYPFTSLFLKKAFGFKYFTLKERLLLLFGFGKKFSASTENRFYKVVPNSVWLVDNSRSFERRIQVPF